MFFFRVKKFLLSIPSENFDFVFLLQVGLVIGLVAGVGGTILIVAVVVACISIMWRSKHKDYDLLDKN